jgi:hypothetical protein
MPPPYSARSIITDVVLRRGLIMIRLTQLGLLIASLLCSSCATVLTEDHPQRENIVGALADHFRATRREPPSKISIATVKVTGRSAIVRCTVTHARPGEVQQPYAAIKAKLTKKDDVWVVQWTKEDVSLLTRIVLPHGK